LDAYTTPTSAGSASREADASNTTPTTNRASNGDTMSLHSLGDGLFEVTSTKYKRNGVVERSVYTVYANALRCDCPGALSGRGNVCKHARFVDAYLSGTGPDTTGSATATTPRVDVQTASLTNAETT